MAPERWILTERLLLRGWNDDDFEPHAALGADPEVMRWIGAGAIRTPEESGEAVARFERDWARYGFGLFAVESRDSGGFIGFVGLSVPDFLPEILPAVEVGWRLARHAWGRGRATEGARAVLSFGFGELGFERIVGIHQVGNRASARIMEKLGMRLERKTVDLTCNRPVRVHEITPSERCTEPRRRAVQRSGTTAAANAVGTR